MVSIPTRSIQTALYALGGIIASAAGLATYAVLARKLPVSEYATYRQIFVVVSVAAPLLAFGLPETLSWVLPGAGTRGRTVASHTVALMLGTSVVFAGVLYLGGGQILATRMGNQELLAATPLLAAFTLIGVPVLAVPSGLVAAGRVTQASGFAAGNRVLAFVLIVGAVMMWPNARTALLAAVVGTGVALLVGVGLLARALPGAFEGLQLSEFSRQLRYAAPIGAVTALAAAFSSVDKLFVSARCSPAEFAAYINGALEFPLISVVTGSAMTIALPEMSLLCQRGQKDDAIDLWKRAACKTALILLPATVFCLVLAPDILTLLFSDRFAPSSATVFRVHLLLLPLRVAFFGTLFQAAGRSEFSLLVFLAGLGTTVLATPVLIDRWGSVGAAVALVGCTWLVQMPLTTYLLYRIYHLPVANMYPLKQLGLRGSGAVLSSIALVPALFWKGGSPALRLALFGTLYSAAVILCYWRAGWVVPAAILRGIQRFWSKGPHAA